MTERNKSNKITIYEKFVWLIISFNQNEDGKAFLNIQDIADEATCSSGRVKQAIETLIERGWLQILQSCFLMKRGVIHNESSVFLNISEKCFTNPFLNNVPSDVHYFTMSIINEFAMTTYVILHFTL